MAFKILEIKDNNTFMHFVKHFVHVRSLSEGSDTFIQVATELETLMVENEIVANTRPYNQHHYNDSLWQLSSQP